MIKFKVSAWISLIGWLLILLVLISFITGDSELNWKNAGVLSIMALISMVSSLRS